MGFLTFAFLALLTLASALYRFVPVRFRAAFLAAVSYGFYLTWDPKMALALLVATALVFAAARRIETLQGTSGADRLIIVSVSLLVLWLAAFKIAEALRLGAGFVIPLGISYYTFKLISYLVDVYWQKASAERSFANFAAYVAFFPQIVAGPIQRAEDFLAQVRRARTPDLVMVIGAVGRIALGCFKKLAVADSLALLVDYGFAHARADAGFGRLAAFYLFPVQLLADFSGLTDIAIGAGRLFGIEAPENFNAPFAAANISEFWRRWHMTLTAWLRDYVFTPLRMAWRNWGDAGLAASITVNMVLIGLWHGLTLPFLTFGLIHSGYLVADALTSSYRKKLYRRRPALNTATNWLGPLVTYHMVAVGDVFFRASSFREGLAIVTRLYSGASLQFSELLASVHPEAWTALAAWMLAAWGMRWLPERQTLAGARRMRWAAVSCTAVVALFLVCFFLARKDTVNPFLYAIF